MAMAKLHLINLALILYLLTGIQCVDHPIVQIKQGAVQGTAELSTHGRIFYSFRGIPYAQPPVGNLRFKDPVPVEPWTDLFIADSDGPMCLQYDSLTYHLIFGQEDCLHINVYTPNLPTDTNTTLLPVAVFFYGGGFGEGADTFAQYGPHRFMDYDMISVTLNYRLGPLGFLSTADPVLPGNQGLLDQLLALKWVQNNIEFFGGNPNAVTIQGESAGAASVHYHVISKASQGLFHQAIYESGNALAPWALQLDPAYWAHLLANEFQCPTDDSELLVECLQQVQGIDLVFTASGLNNYSFIALPFLAVVEDPSYGKFLTETPIKVLESGEFTKVPTMSGVNRDEGSLFYGETANYFSVIDDHFFNEILPDMLQNFTHFKYNFVNMSYAIKDEYFTAIDVENSSQVIRTAIDIFSDFEMFSINDMSVRLLTNWTVPVYVYFYDYAGDLFLTNYSGQPEVAHTSELLFIFNASFLALTDRDSKVSETLVQMWSNFIISGDPNPTGFGEWTPTPIGHTNYLDIQENSAVMKEDLFAQRCWFWNEYLPTIGGSQYE